MESKRKKKRKLLRFLKEEGELSHEELSMRLGIDWDQTQELIRELRNEDKVRISLGRRYVLNDE